MTVGKRNRRLDESCISKPKSRNLKMDELGVSHLKFVHFERLSRRAASFSSGTITSVLLKSAGDATRVPAGAAVRESCWGLRTPLLE